MKDIRLEYMLSRKAAIRIDLERSVARSKPWSLAGPVVAAAVISNCKIKGKLKHYESLKNIWRFSKPFKNQTLSIGIGIMDK